MLTARVLAVGIATCLLVSSCVTSCDPVPTITGCRDMVVGEETDLTAIASGEFTVKIWHWSPGSPAGVGILVGSLDDGTAGGFLVTSARQVRFRALAQGMVEVTVSTTEDQTGGCTIRITEPQPTDPQPTAAPSPSVTLEGGVPSPSATSSPPPTAGPVRPSPS